MIAIAAGMLLSDPHHWRRRAEEMRNIAEDIKGEAKQIALQLAADYEELARRAEEWLKRE